MIYKPIVNKFLSDLQGVKLVAKRFLNANYYSGRITFAI
jgi:hypothetical protein